MALREVVSDKQGKNKICDACKRTPNDEKCGTRNLHAHTLGAAPASVARITPLHEDANDASFASEPLSKEKAERNAFAVAQAVGFESAGLPLFKIGPAGHVRMKTNT